MKIYPPTLKYQDLYASIDTKFVKSQGYSICDYARLQIMKSGASKYEFVKGKKEEDVIEIFD